MHYYISLVYFSTVLIYIFLFFFYQYFCSTKVVQYSWYYHLPLGTHVQGTLVVSILFYILWTLFLSYCLIICFCIYFLLVFLTGLLKISSHTLIIYIFFSCKIHVSPSQRTLDFTIFFKTST